MPDDLNPLNLSPNGKSPRRGNPSIPPVHVHQEAFDPSNEHTVVFQPSGRRGTVPEGTTVLEAARRLGVGIESICGGRQTCSKCYVRVESGAYARLGITSSSAHVTPPGEREIFYRHKRGLPEEFRYSCDACVIGDAVISVPAASQSHKQVVRKAARERAIAVDPVIRKYYVELAEPDLEHPGSDAERVIEDLRARFPELADADLTFDYPALRSLQRALREGEWAVTLTVWKGHEILRVQPGYEELAVGLAVDIGTTSLAAYLCDLRTGALLATESTMNPQVAYGEDVMSRISFAMEEQDGLDRLHALLIDGLNDLARQAASQAGLDPGEIVDLVLVANSAIHHLLLGFDVRYLGLAPFVPAVMNPLDLRARDLGLSAVHPGARVHILPLEAGFVGADNVGVLLAEEPYHQDEIALIIDVGTNGEIVLGSRDRLLCTSSPTGPALEGAQIRYGMRAAPGAIERVRIDPATLEPRFKVIGQQGWSDELPPEALGARGICGSGIIEAVAEMWNAGIVDDTGKWNTQLEHPRLTVCDGFPAYVLATAEQSALDEPVMVTLADVRAIQLAKAALYTGAKILMRELGIEYVERIVLAGAFGSYLDPQRTMMIGMIPDCDLARVHAVGNAAGDGARIALLNGAKRREAAQMARFAEHITLPLEGDFQDIFMNALNFPNAEDAFPHLERVLAEQDARTDS